LWGVQPDLMCTAKAITNGYFPFGAVMIGGKVTEVFESNADAFGAIGHGYTYSAHPVGAAAALACLPEITKANVADNAAARGAELLAGAEALMARHDVVGDVRGKGLMVALELVSDRERKTPAAKDTVATVFETAYRAGVMVRTSGPNIILSPPLVITSEDVAKILAALDAGLSAIA
jgi:adenosylmethionine-8-amino-7-oxononanoate aminotransferase